MFRGFGFKGFRVSGLSLEVLGLEWWMGFAARSYANRPLPERPPMYLEGQGALSVG